MILIDFNQIAFATILEHLAYNKQADASIAMVRHMMLSSLRANVKKFKPKYGEVVVAYDSNEYWRREQFPFYKHSRKKNRDKSDFNWKSIFLCMDTLREEFQQNLMYKVLRVPKAEADDIIGTLTPLFCQTQSIVIISGDKDFKQLQTYPNVVQYSPLLKKMLVEETPSLTLKQHIIRGDSGDGIPNILSPDDCFVTGTRQKPIHEKKLIGWLNTPVEEFCVTEQMLRNYKRNEKLIDLKQIPEDLKHSIGVAYESANFCTRSQFFNYLVASGLRELTRMVEDF